MERNSHSHSYSYSLLRCLRQTFKIHRKKTQVLYTERSLTPAKRLNERKKRGSRGSPCLIDKQIEPARQVKLADLRFVFAFLNEIFAESPRVLDGIRV